MWKKASLIIVLGFVVTPSQAMVGCKTWKDCPACESTSMNPRTGEMSIDTERVRYCDQFGRCQCGIKCDSTTMCEHQMSRDCNELNMGMRVCNMTNPQWSHCMCKYECNASTDCMSSKIKCGRPGMHVGCMNGKCMCMMKKHGSSSSSSSSSSEEAMDITGLYVDHTETRCHTSTDCMGKTCSSGKTPMCKMVGGVKKCKCVHSSSEETTGHETMCHTSTDCWGKTCPTGRTPMCKMVGGVKKCMCVHSSSEETMETRCHTSTDCWGKTCSSGKTPMCKMVGGIKKCMCVHSSTEETMDITITELYVVPETKEMMCHTSTDCMGKTCTTGKMPMCKMVGGVKKCMCVQCQMKYECPLCKEQGLERMCTTDGKCKCIRKHYETETETEMDMELNPFMMDFVSKVDQCQVTQDCIGVKSCGSGMVPVCKLIGGMRKCKCMECEKSMDCEQCPHGKHSFCTSQGKCTCTPRTFLEATMNGCHTVHDCPPCHHSGSTHMMPMCVHGQCMCKHTMMEEAVKHCRRTDDCENLTCPENQKPMCVEGENRCRCMPKDVCTTVNDCPVCDQTMKQTCFKHNKGDFKRCSCIKKDECHTSRDCNQGNGAKCSGRFIWFKSLVAPSCCVKCGTNNENAVGRCRCDAGGRLGYCPNGRDGWVTKDVC